MCAHYIREVESYLHTVGRINEVLVEYTISHRKDRSRRACGNEGPSSGKNATHSRSHRNVLLGFELNNIKHLELHTNLYNTNSIASYLARHVTVYLADCNKHI